MMLTEDTARLKKLDELMKLRADKYVQLPLIVVVGDQSSGKSSVLEGLNGLPLAIDAGLCTSIAPQNDGAAEAEDRFHEFSVWAQKYQTKCQLEGTGLVEVLDRAAIAMGLPARGNQKAPDQSAFSEDVLNIDISGPEYDHLGIVDLPGIFRQPTPGQTHDRDIEFVRSLIKRHLHNQRAIILAVVPANVDLATSEMENLAKEADPTAVRTLGVLTKTDLVDEGAESKVLDLLSAGGSSRSLGYIAVCNRKQKDQGTSIEERHANESRFFDKPPWSAVLRHRAGITALKKRLNTLMIEIARKEFDSVTLDIGARLRKAEKAMSKIPGPRDTAKLQRRFLSQAAAEFTTLSTRAIDAYYTRDKVFAKHPSLKLATTIVGMNEKFSREMFSNGASRLFVADNNDEDCTEQSADEHIVNQTPDTDSTDDHVTAGSPPAEERSDKLSADTTLASLDDVFKMANRPPPSGRGGIKEWIKAEYLANRGFEMGMPSPTVVPSLFAQQAGTWRYYAFKHVRSVIGYLHDFMRTLLGIVLSDALVADRVWRSIQSAIQSRFKKAMEHVEFLLKAETGDRLLTMNHYFAENLKKARMRRVQTRLKGAHSWASSPEKEPLVSLDDVVNIYTSNDDSVVEDIHDILSSYHKVARKRFVDAVCVQAIDHYLLCKPNSPLEIFTTDWVLMLGDDELQALAGEDDATKAEREALVVEITSLRKARDVLAS